jgi:hypothetical protein
MLEPVLASDGVAVRRTRIKDDRMPSLFRFLFVLGILAGLAYGAMFALILFVEPTQGEMTIRIPNDRLNLDGN